MVETELGLLREISKSVFGQALRLELMLLVAHSDDGVVCLTELAKSLEVSVSSLQRPFESLIAAKLLSPLPDSDSRFRYYLRNPSAAWEWADELADQARPL
jgi:DNA-binding IclR family transcriptional regulator